MDYGSPIEMGVNTPPMLAAFPGPTAINNGPLLVQKVIKEVLDVAEGTVAESEPLALGIVEEPSAGSQVSAPISKRLPNNGMLIVTRMMELFRGNPLAVPKHWESEDGKRKGYSPICKNKWKPICALKKGGHCNRCENQDYATHSPALLYKHVAGEIIIGSYALLPNNTCYFVALDLDNHDGKRDPHADVLALDAVREVMGLPPFCIFRSKSGKGFHIYIFFKKPVPAAKGRMVFHFLCEEAQIIEEDEDQETSFDRFIPNQDEHSGKGFGNLIALPYQGKVATKELQHTLMLTPESGFTIPYNPQLTALNSIIHTTEEQLDALIAEYDLKPLGSGSAKKPDGASGSPSGAQYKSSGPGDGTADAERILERCAFMRHCRDDAVRLPEGQWFAMVSNLARCADGMAVVHRLSAPYPAYVPADTTEKARHAIQDSGPITCAHIKNTTRNKYCGECQETCKSPIVLGRARNEISEGSSRFREFDEPTQVGGVNLRPGVYSITEDDKGNPKRIWICNPLHIEAITRDSQGNNFGRMLRFKITTGGWREFPLPMEFLKGSGEELRGILLGMGLEISTTSEGRGLLNAYLQSVVPEKIIQCTNQTGWCSNNYVLPDRTFGPDADQIVFQSGEQGHGEFTTNGTFVDWRDLIAAYAQNNPILTIAISASFAGPLLHKTNSDSGGLHLIGDSSTGKSTAIYAAVSVWGGPLLLRSWRMTANGLEGIAVMCNDNLLTLDEISEADPREVGAITYCLGNGKGKQRASRSGAARSVKSFRCSVLSSGERSVATAMEEGGFQSKAGQSVRLLDLPVARKHGAWDDLYHFTAGSQFSDHIKKAAGRHYGHAGRLFLEKLTLDQTDFCLRLDVVKGLPGFAASESSGSGQEKRAAARFALIALAGELATEYGITGWRPGEATDAAATAFHLWRVARGEVSGNNEVVQISGQVSRFIDRHGDSRFSAAEDTQEWAVRDRAGWYRDTEDQGRLFLFTSDGIREALKGFDLKRGLDALQTLGAMPYQNVRGERAKAERLFGRVVKVYGVLAEKLTQ